MSQFKRYLATEYNTGLGLIFRLNNLMHDMEYTVLNGNYQKWNILLDRIYCNITYKNPMEIVKDEKGRIMNIALNEEDKKIYTLLNGIVGQAFKSKDKLRMYNALMKKELWLKKKMYELNIYLKHVSSDPGSAIFGGG